MHHLNAQDLYKVFMSLVPEHCTIQVKGMTARWDTDRFRSLTHPNLEIIPGQQELGMDELIIDGVEILTWINQNVTDADALQAALQLPSPSTST